MKYIKTVKTPLLLAVVMFVLCGLVYPAVTTVIAQLAFPHQANGSMVVVNGSLVGSALVGQNFTDPRFMKCRPSKVNYNVYSDEQKKNGEYTGLASGSDNYAPSNPDLEARVAEDFVEFIKGNMETKEIPLVLLTSSNTLLAPYTVPQDALAQVPALMESTGLSEQELSQIIEENTFGEMNGVTSSDIFEVRGKNGTLSEKELASVQNTLAESEGKIVMVSKVNLAIMKKVSNGSVDLTKFPADLLTASGSGLDPHISPDAAMVQLPALVKNTGLSEETLLAIVEHNTTNKVLGIFGEETVNVLGVNLEIAQLLGIV